MTTGLGATAGSEKILYPDEYERGKIISDKERKGFQKSSPVVNGALPARTARQGEGRHSGARRAERQMPPAADGQDRKGLRQSKWPLCDTTVGENPLRAWIEAVTMIPDESFPTTHLDIDRFVHMEKEGARGLFMPHLT